jgi:hypothetical protein
LYAVDVRLVPYRQLALHSDEAPDVVGSKLARLVVQSVEFMTYRPEPFRGSFRGRCFKVVRREPLYNPWRPVIVGDVVPHATGTLVTVRFRMAVLPAAYTAFLFALSFSAIALGMLQATTPLRAAAEMTVSLFVMYGWMCFVFGREVEKAHRTLRDGLACREVQR